ncbi:hypothetical protein BRC82_10600 [Halobacteriales archaeon QS_1_67_19]|nr:MAG: hypothetical protein BRC82_10600 [Halobacteriales archaeon QS_1_67_19]
MTSTTRTTKPTELYDQLSAAISRERSGANASLTTAQVLMWNVGGNELVGLEAGCERAVFNCTDDGFAAAIPFDESGVHGDRAELLGRGEAITEGLASVEYEWVHPEYRSRVTDS